MLNCLSHRRKRKPQLEIKLIGSGGFLSQFKLILQVVNLQNMFRHSYVIFSCKWAFLTVVHLNFILRYFTKLRVTICLFPCNYIVPFCFLFYCPRYVRATFVFREFHIQIVTQVLTRNFVIQMHICKFLWFFCQSPFQICTAKLQCVLWLKSLLPEPFLLY